MAYGDTMAYTYAVDVEDENGEVHSESETLHFTYNSNTTLIYKRLFNSDLLVDITKLSSTTMDDIPKETREKIESGELTLDSLDKIDFNEIDVGNKKAEIDTVILTQIAIALVATNDSCNHKPRRSVEEIANELPDIGINPELMIALLNFIMFGLKKKKTANRRY